MEESISIYRTIDRQKRLYEEVVNQITDLVLRKRLQPGDRLPSERHLAEELGVSRTAIREAVKALEQKRLIEVKQGSGTFIRNLIPESISESFSLFVQTDIARYFQLLEIRGILDVEVAARLAERATEEDLRILDEKIVQMRKLLDSPKEFAAADVAFHLAIYRATKNEVLLTIMQPITELLAKAMEMTVQAPGSAQSSLRRHEDLVERIRARDAEGARRVMGQINSRGEERLKEALRGMMAGSER